MPEILKNISRINVTADRGAVIFDEVVYAPGGSCGPRIQQDYQLVVIHRGSLELRLDGKKIDVPAGHAILLAPGHREHFLFSRDSATHHSWCVIRPSAVPAGMRRMFGSIGVSAPFDSHLSALLKLGKAPPANDSANQTLANGYGLGLGLALLFGFALTVQARGKVRNSGDEALMRLDDFVSREYDKPLQLADLAIAAGVSRQHLMKLFRERRRSTPTRYLYEKRLETAADQLARTGLSVGEIASRCGFANPFHFSRKFRLAYGRSPRAWRVQTWSEKGRGRHGLIRHRI